jgi:putative transcriptional regulator
MIKNHLSRLMGERKMKQSELARLTGIRPNTVSDLYNEFASAISFDHLESICRVLKCGISDLLEIVPNEQQSEEQNKP